MFVTEMIPFACRMIVLLAFLRLLHCPVYAADSAISFA